MASDLGGALDAHAACRQASPFRRQLACRFACGGSNANVVLHCDVSAASATCWRTKLPNPPSFGPPCEPLWEGDGSGPAPGQHGFRCRPDCAGLVVTMPLTRALAGEVTHRHQAIAERLRWPVFRLGNRCRRQNKTLGRMYKIKLPQFKCWTGPVVQARVAEHGACSAHRSQVHVWTST